ncbi:hypothetical protein LOK49_LG02G04014 [Camellia lanceoleosa]|uniref:Uncharacterized protein n=1 Tax=Camellia lanceoleosa TaxID=1840588 RepID=A0ACC0IN42_9ERIC|nr:hypothetical protein LOK49_LG02G04014 [Camellia lanceoleosa]
MLRVETQHRSWRHSSAGSDSDRAKEYCSKGISIVNKVVHSKATRLHRVNAQDSVTGGTKANDKVGVNKYNRLGNGKENVTSQRPNTGAGGTVQQVQIVTEQKSIVPKVNKVVHSKATRLHRVDAQDSVTGGTKANDKVGVNKYNRLGNGRENVMSQRPNTGAGGMVQQVQIVTEQKSIVPKTQDLEIAENMDTVVAPPRKSVVEPNDRWAFSEYNAIIWVELSELEQFIDCLMAPAKKMRRLPPPKRALLEPYSPSTDTCSPYPEGLAADGFQPIGPSLSQINVLSGSETIAPTPSQTNAPHGFEICEASLSETQAPSPQSQTSGAVVGGRKLEGRKSSSGKSGVGSSSHPGYNVKNRTLCASLNKDVTPDNNQNAMRAPQANCDKVRKSNTSKESTAKTRDLTFKSGCGSKIIAAAKSAHLETAKSKVNKVVHSKATRLHRVDAQDSVTGGTKENDKVNKVVHSKATKLHRVDAQDSVTGGTKANDKVGVNKYNRLGNGRENVMSQRPNTGAGGMVQQVQIVTEQKSIVPKTQDLEIAENMDTVVAPPRKSVVEPVDQWAFLPKLLTIPKDSDQTDEKQSEDVGDDDDDKKGMKWALPGLQQPKVSETLSSSSSFFPSDFFVTSESLGLDSHVLSSLDGSHGRLVIII